MGAPRKRKKRSKFARRVIKLREALGEDADTFGRRMHRTGRAVEEWEQDRRVPDQLVIDIIDRLEAEL